MNKLAIDCVVAVLKNDYFHSEVTSGEFIHTVVIPDNILGNDINRENILQGIQEFLNWDESPEEFDVIKFGNHWYTTKHFTSYEDYYTFAGINYPTKILTVTIDEHNDDWVHSYLVAPESLYDAIENYSGDTGDERHMESIDSEVYHYIVDEFWDESPEELAKSHLDLPMTYVPEE